MKKNTRKAILGLVVLLFVVIGYLGWKQTGGGSSNNLTTITIGYQAGDEIDLAKLRGQLKKKMKAKGYNVKFKEFQNGSAEMQALASGSIDYARVGDTPGVTALASGTKLTYIGVGGTKENGTGILVKKSSGITSLSDLKGKKIAYTKGTSSQYLVMKALKKAGLSTSDVTLVNLDQSAAATAYANGSVDAWVNWDPTTSKLELSGSTLVTNGKAIGDNNRSYLIASTSFAKKHTEASKLLIKYLASDMKWANSHHSLLIKKWSKELKLSKATVKMMVNRRTYSFSKMNKTAVSELQDIADLFYKNNVIKKKVTVKNFVNYLK